MLGIGKKKTNFQVAAHGKHPAFNDYFSLNIDFPMAEALVNWMEKGTALRTNHDNNIHAFRFWIRGIKKGELIFGIIRDSSDILGRAYPLLIIARGIVKNWEKKWYYIFSSFDTVFRAFEDITASQYENFKAFATRLSKVISFESSALGGAGLEWQYQYKILNERSRLPEIMRVWFNKNMEKGAMLLSVKTLFNEFTSYNPDLKCRGAIKDKKEIPGAAFMGGLPDDPVLAIFSRPLKAEDFLIFFNF